MPRTWPCWAIFVAALVMPFPSRSQEPNPQEQQRPPRPIEPPHKQAQQGFRFTATLGLALIGNGKYSYNTTGVIQNGSALDYSGTHRSDGATVLAGAATTPPGVLRRLTLGFDLNIGGLAVWEHSVTTAGSSMLLNNLNALIAQNSLVRPPWRPFVSPYIEHELGSIFQNRIRLGYQHWQTAGSYQGSAANLSGSAQGSYHVRFSQAAHLIRLSVNNDTWTDVTETNQMPPKRRFGIVTQGGVLIGTDGTITAFVNIGPVWIF